MGALPIFFRRYSKVLFTGRLSCVVPARRLRLGSTSGPSVLNWKSSWRRLLNLHRNKLNPNHTRNRLL